MRNDIYALYLMILYNPEKQITPSLMLRKAKLTIPRQHVRKEYSYPQEWWGGGQTFQGSSQAEHTPHSAPSPWRRALCHETTPQCSGRPSASPLAPPRGFWTCWDSPWWCLENKDERSLGVYNQKVNYSIIINFNCMWLIWGIRKRWITYNIHFEGRENKLVTW